MEKFLPTTSKYKRRKCILTSHSNRLSGQTKLSHLNKEQMVLSGCVLHFLHSKAERTESSQLNQLWHLPLPPALQARPGSQSSEQPWGSTRELRYDICTLQPTPLSLSRGLQTLFHKRLITKGSQLHIMSESPLEVHHPAQTPGDGLSSLGNHNFSCPVPTPSPPPTHK